MKLRELIKHEKEIVNLEVDSLAGSILVCIPTDTSNSIKRRGLAAAILRDYPREDPQSIYAIEEAILWLEKELLIGPDPTDPDMIFITRKGKAEISKWHQQYLQLPITSTIMQVV